MIVTKYLIKQLLHYNLIQDNEKIIIQYGLNGLLSTFCSFTTVFIIGLYNKCFLESIIFTISLYFLRIYAGGYHANTQKKCYITSLLISIFLFAFIRQIILPEKILNFFTISACITIIFLAPIDTCNKPLDIMEKKFFKKVTFCLTAVHLLLYYISYYSNIYPLCWSLAMSLSVTAILLIYAKITKRRVIAKRT